MRICTWVLLTCCLYITPPAFSEPADNASNEWGLWHVAEPGHFVPRNQPNYLAADEAALADDANVIGVEVSGDARAFPIRLMTFHHVVNDRIGGERLAVTYCIMANTAVCYRLLDDTPGLEAGGLFGGVLAMREQGTRRCWPQIATVALPEDPLTTGTLVLAKAPAITTWKLWRAAYPQTRVLAPDHDFDMRYEAYDRRTKNYVANPLMNTSITHTDARLGPGVEVYGLALDGAAWASPLDHLREVGRAEATLGGRQVAVVWDKALETPRVEGDFPGYALRSYWYAWAQFYPATELAK